MATEQELETRINSLEAQKASGVADVDYGGSRVRYRGIDEIERVIATTRRELQALKGEAVTRQVRFFTRGGY